MLTLRQIILSQGNKVLLNQASVALYEKQKIGLVGRNGCGKSSLFALFLNQLLPDAGEYFINPHLRISHLSQQLPDSNQSALDFVLAGDEEYLALQQQLIAAENAGRDEEVLACHERLVQTAGYSKPAQAAIIMAGLGFREAEIRRPVNSFSGGWQMRLSLGRCLMTPAELLLLDEPTNHLDMEAIFWLEKWLKQTHASVIVISHDREFLDAFITHVLHIDQQNLKLYSGNYSRFEQTRAHDLSLQQLTYEKQQQKINHLMSYVTRFRAKASKATQAQSRLKRIASLETVAKATIDSPFSFDFYPCPNATNPLIRTDNVDMGYNQGEIILNHVNLVLNPGDRIALLGPNGAGKSTLIKTLIGATPPFSGVIQNAATLKIGYYAQHQLEDLAIHLSPLQIIQALSPDAREQTIRDYLGGFNFVGDMAVCPIAPFSGGEKARVALAKLIWQKPNLLLLDEPTNHLDLDMRSAIEIALQSYEGGVILISHDRHLLRSTIDDFYLVYQQRVQPFKGCLADYYQWLLTKDVLLESPKVTTANNAYRERKIWQNRLKKLELQLEEWRNQLLVLEEKLADLTLYDNAHKTQLISLLNMQKTMVAKQLIAEEEWLTVAELIETSKEL